MKEIRLILASQSPRRLEILRQIGFQPEVIVSGIEEHTEETIPERVVMDLSRQKAGNVAARLAASLVPVNDLAGRLWLCSARTRWSAQAGEFLESLTRMRRRKR